MQEKIFNLNKLNDDLHKELYEVKMADLEE